MDDKRKLEEYENPQVLPLQKGFIYGPVNSRRLGSSLGLNLSPRNQKLCSLNCIYCQYGLKAPKTYSIDSTVDYGAPSAADIEKALLAALSSLPEQVNYITFSGNGEPTLHPDFPEIVDIVMGIRDKYAPHSKLAILTNSTTINNPSIAEALLKMEMPILKLDAGSKELFKIINRPAKGVEFDDIVNGLVNFDHSNLIIQALIMGGPDLNASEENIVKWSNLLSKIKPREVQIYSLDRPPAKMDVIKLPFEELQRIAAHASELSGIKVVPY